MNAYHPSNNFRYLDFGRGLRGLGVANHATRKPLKSAADRGGAVGQSVPPLRGALSCSSTRRYPVFERPYALPQESLFLFNLRYTARQCLQHEWPYPEKAQAIDYLYQGRREGVELSEIRIIGLCLGLTWEEIETLEVCVLPEGQAGANKKEQR